MCALSFVISRLETVAKAEKEIVNLLSNVVVSFSTSHPIADIVPISWMTKKMTDSQMENSATRYRAKTTDSQMAHSEGSDKGDNDGISDGELGEGSDDGDMIYSQTKNSTAWKVGFFHDGSCC
jgi:hypothetical protein